MFYFRDSTAAVHRSAPCEDKEHQSNETENKMLQQRAGSCLEMASRKLHAMELKTHCVLQNSTAFTRCSMECCNSKMLQA